MTYPDITKWMEEASTELAQQAGKIAYSEAALTRLIEMIKNSDISMDDLEAELQAARDDARMALEVAWVTAGMANGLDVAKMMEDG
jgi:hypothetical protein